MKAEVHFLNVGWGDAHFIVMPSGALALIDGGSGDSEACEDEPLAWMVRRGADTLDWMILTHLHEDHLNGLLLIAEEKKVKRAILPYPSFNIPGEEVLEKYGGIGSFQKVYRLLEKYLRLIALLEEQETEILWRSEYGSKGRETIWTEEGYTLAHLYPLVSEGDPLPAWDVLCSGLTGYQTGTLDWHLDFELFFRLSNHDCSVYSLTWQNEAEKETVLFGGDLYTEDWQRLSCRTDLRAGIWKAPHHGKPDSFNEATLALVNPEYTIIPNSISLAELIKSHWSSLGIAPGSLRLTGEYPAGKGECIADGAIKVFVGSPNV